jgi:hypothetical protein
MTQISPEQALHYIRSLEDRCTAIYRALVFKELEIAELITELNNAKVKIVELSEEKETV